ncbi:hypothetical protein BM885_005288, partial [Escherichia coli]|nr:hypothetical protein [Escherichia coli]
MKTAIASTQPNDGPPAFENSYAALPDRFFQAMQANPVSAPSLIRLNEGLAQDLGLDAGWLAGADGLAMLAGNAFPASA